MTYYKLSEFRITVLSFSRKTKVHINLLTVGDDFAEQEKLVKRRI